MNVTSLTAHLMIPDRVYKQAIKRVFTEKCHDDFRAVYWGRDEHDQRDRLSETLRSQNRQTE